MASNHYYPTKNQVFDVLSNNIRLLTNIQYLNYHTMTEEINKLKKEKIILETQLKEEKENKRKRDDETDSDLEEKPKKPKKKRKVNKYHLIKYNTTEGSYDDDTINQLFYSLKNIKDIIALEKRYVNIRHNLKLQCLHNLIPALKRLDMMVGLDQVKEDLFKVIIYYVQNQHVDEYLHTVIEGPPGVGKTEFAKIYADIFVRLGILKKETFIQIKRDDLVAKYLGQTAPKTKQLLENAMGGVIFLDEAYSLGDSEKRDSFSKEAIDMINQYLSERKDEFMFIIAGYEDDLERCFFGFNKGLKRRFSHFFKIEKYNDKELKDIFKSKIEHMGYILKVEDIALNNFFKENYERFENYAGDIEKLINYIKYEQSMRCFRNNIDNDNVDILFEDIIGCMSKFKKIRDDKPPLGMYI